MKIRVPAAILLAAALFLGACGGESNEEKAQKAFAEAMDEIVKEGNNEASATDGPDVSASDSADDDSSDSSDTSNDANDASDTGDSSVEMSLPPGFENSGECLQVTMAYASLGLASLGGMMGGESISESDLADLNASIDELSANLPDEIQGDFAIIAEAYNIAAEEGFTSGAASAALGSDEFIEADERVGQFIENLCTSS